MEQMDNAPSVSDSEFMLFSKANSTPDMRISRSFLGNYQKCMLSFVSHNCAIIKQAAGWAALRVWLLVRHLRLIILDTERSLTFQLGVCR